MSIIPVQTESQQPLGRLDDALTNIPILSQGVVPQEVDGTRCEVELMELALLVQRDPVRELSELDPAGW
jgi:hypothetical protein